MRLQKYISNFSSISRRKAEQLIKEGLVKVNGIVNTIPYYDVQEKDKVYVKGKLIKPPKEYQCFVFYKPSGYLSSFYDQNDQKGIKEFFENRSNLKIAGRLDYFSEGILVITNHTKLINILTHPSYQIEKEYLVFSYQIIKKELISNFKKGITIDGEFYKAIDFDLIKDTVARIVLKEGKNREIRNVFATFKQPIARLLRVRIGPLKIGNLKPGEKKQVPLSIIEPLLFQNKVKKEIEDNDDYSD
ncbi:MAG: pseudouridine synthase [Exilispira sp.]